MAIDTRIPLAGRPQEYTSPVERLLKLDEFVAELQLKKAQMENYRQTAEHNKYLNEESAMRVQRMKRDMADEDFFDKTIKESMDPNDPNLNPTDSFMKVFPVLMGRNQQLAQKYLGGFIDQETKLNKMRSDRATQSMELHGQGVRVMDPATLNDESIFNYRKQSMLGMAQAHGASKEQLEELDQSIGPWTNAEDVKERLRQLEEGSLSEAQSHAREVEAGNQRKEMLDLMKDTKDLVGPDGKTYAYYFNPKTGKHDIQGGQVSAKTSAIDQLASDTVLVEGMSGPQDILVGRDPNDATHFGKKFLPTEQGLKDVTGKTKPYERPPAALIVNQANEKEAASLPDNYRRVLARTMLNTPVNRRGEINKIAADYYKDGDEAGLKGFIVQSAIENERSETTKRQVEGRRDALLVLNDIESILKDLKAAGVNTNLLRGKTEDVARTLGTSTDPRLADLGARLDDALNTYRLAMTGVAFSQQEAKSYANLWPDYTNTFPLNEALIKGIRANMNTRQRSFFENKLGKEGADLLGTSMITTGSGTAASPSTSGAGGGIGIKPGGAMERLLKGVK